MLRIRGTFPAIVHTFGLLVALPGAVRVDFAADSSLAVDEKNVCGLNSGIEFHVVLSSAPGITRIVQQIVHLILIVFHLAKLLNWHVDN